MLQARLSCPYCNNLAGLALTMVLEFQTVKQNPLSDRFPARGVRAVLPSGVCARTQTTTARVGRCTSATKWRMRRSPRGGKDDDAGRSCNEVPLNEQARRNVTSFTLSRLAEGRNCSQHRHGCANMAELDSLLSCRGDRTTTAILEFRRPGGHDNPYLGGIFDRPTSLPEMTEAADQSAGDLLCRFVDDDGRRFVRGVLVALAGGISLWGLFALCIWSFW
jgi:hypothetical protein